ncbi:hypothetical protein CUB78_06690 [Prochlorococcus marinus str. XMU1401]|uniref:ATP-grasp domain-containing protein n=1 Tax=Prochlorococcus marinus str. XMU1401 TaxID=2052594 RepID=A0A8I1X6X5_PROMR|nr:hypothetical protein [Prochlorococcus marinus]MBO8223290.1 hypothetical protein [Prochlorococcus marinus str. XMU1401]MBW3059822.1 hypothetical protein [Prochlorococcus marinus str. XMU1401E]MCQ9198952.1 hypothetical protein [Prochlorococcus marinus XMU1429]PJC83636.1 hypothetical protein CUB78_06690 [Prochlorococcus marinus str. XMU1401]
MSNWIICLGGSVNQVPYLKEIRKMNLKIFLLDKNKEAPGIEFSDKYQSTGYDQINELEDLVKKEFFYTNKIKYVFSAASQFSQIGVSILSELLELDFINKDNIINCLDKKNFYRIFEKLSAPIPKTELIYNFEKLRDSVLSSNEENNWYLKSDLGKSPHYIYRINKENLYDLDIFWGKDRYLSECYLLQPEFEGIHLRINIFNNSFCIFDHSNEELVEDPIIINSIKEFNIFKKLVEIQKYFNFEKLICKFDVILNSQSWVVIDIGIDPPSRIKKLYLKHNINFHKLYVQLLLQENVDLPYFTEI